MTCRRTIHDAELERTMMRVRENMAEYASAGEPFKQPHSKPLLHRFKSLTARCARSLFWICFIFLYLWGISE